MSFFLNHSFLEIKKGLLNGDYSKDDLVVEVKKTLRDGDPCKAFVRTESTNYSFKKDRLFSGFPIAVKDIFNTKDFPTEMGSQVWKDFTPGNDARVVFNAKENGCLVFGKTITAEFAVHELNESLNPHNVNKTPGTSSSGSAVAVAKGYVPIALGTQTAGSIIRPASFCGVIGFKPSFGLIPRTGVLKTCDPFDTVGFFTSHLDYLQPFLDSIRVKGRNYPYVHKHIDLGIRKNKERLKIGFLKTHTWDLAKEYVRNSLEEYAKGLSKAHEVVELNWPNELSTCHEIHRIVYHKSLSYYFQNEFRNFPQHISKTMASIIDEGEKIPVRMFQANLESLVTIRKTVFDLLSDFDCVFTNSTGSSAPLRGEREIDDPSLIWTMSHIPAMSIPLFRCPENMPFGVQFIAKKWSDFNLINSVANILSNR